MNLSEDARALFLGAFLNPRATLTYQNVSNRMPERTRNAMEELEAEGLVLRIVSINGAETFILTDKGKDLDRMKVVPLGRDIFSFMQGNDLQLMEPKP